MKPTELLSAVRSLSREIEYRWFVILLLLSISNGCATTHKITYDMGDIKPRHGPSLSKYILDIQPLEDIRKEAWENVILWGDSRKIFLDKKQQCVNINKHYDNGVVSPQITGIIAEHIKKKGSFKDVSVNNKELSDFYVTGKIERFFGRREYSQTASTTGIIGTQYGAIGGAISALLIAAMKAPGEIEIVFKDVVVRNREGKIIGEIGDLKLKTEKEMRVDGNCWTTYAYVDEQLKIIVEDMANKIEAAILLYVKNHNTSYSD